MKNSQHLKAYVQLHPDNKMAWYLLGKEYYKNGQQGKANYCFNQAGEVYEAFEHSKVPAEMLREYEEGLLQAGRLRDRRNYRVRRTLLALAALLLIVMPSAAAPGLDSAGEEKAAQKTVASVNSDAPANKAPAAVPDVAPAAVDAPAATEAVFTAQESGQASASGKLLAEVLKDKQPSITAVLGMKRSGKWLLWKERLPLESTVEKSGDGRIVYQSYNPAVCACQPPEQGELPEQAAQWQGEQEDLAALGSAMKAYKSSKGKQPDTLQDLAGPFPGNWIGGTTPVMEREFEPMKAKAAGSSPVVPSATPQASAELPTATPAAVEAGEPEAEVGAGGEMPFFAEPLTIIVDKQNHRLAVASGSVLLRNYKVGLGGGRTPEGSFVITDKVVNPNGRDNGEFGSRGMQLSDSNYAIHGTDEPDSMGKDESLGCIRMSRTDVEELFALVPRGTKVLISKGVLPEELLLPEERFTSDAQPDQTNPRKVYHWLN